MGIYVDFSQLFEWIGVVTIVGFIVVLFLYLKSNYKVSRRGSKKWQYDDEPSLPDADLNTYEWFTEEQVDLLKEQNRVHWD